MSWIEENSTKYSDDRNAYKGGIYHMYEFDLGHEDLKDAYAQGARDCLIEVKKIVEHMVSRDYRDEVIQRIEELGK